MSIAPRETPWRRRVVTLATGGALWAACAAAPRRTHPSLAPTVVALRERCARGDGAACSGVAVAYQRGRGAPHDRARGVLYARAGCAYGSAWACEEIALAYERGRDAPPDAAMTARFRARACDGGDARACYERAEAPLDTADADARESGRALHARRVGGLRAAGHPLRVRARRRGRCGSRRRVYQRGCDLGAAVACGNLGVQMMRAQGVPLDVERAAPLLVRACEGGSAIMCVNASEDYRLGRGVPVDRARAPCSITPCS